MNTIINRDVFEPFPALHSERLNFEKFTLKDDKDLFEIRGSSEVVKHMDTFPHRSVLDSKSMIQEILKDHKDQTGIHWTMRLKGNSEMIGYFGFWRLDYSHCRGEIGYALKPQFWRQGYLSETFKVMIDFGFDQMNLHGIEGNVNPDNIPSKGLLEKMGFQQEAHFRKNYLHNGKYTDSLIYCMLETDWPLEI